MTCFEKNHTQANMTKTIDQYQGESMWYQKEIIKLQNELECYKKNGDVKSDVVKRQQEILDKILFELPVGNVTTHTYENIPDRVKYYVREHALLESNQDEANELIAQSMPNFFDHPSAGYILDNTALLIGIADKAKIEAWADREDLEALQQVIETFYEYYAGFGAKKDLTTTQMLNHLLQTIPINNITDDSKNLETLMNANSKYSQALVQIANHHRKADTCKLIAQKALGLLDDCKYQPELLIEDNLALRMKVEDLESQLINITLEKVFPKESHPLMDCPDCGKHWDYHHEEHCEAKI